MHVNHPHGFCDNINFKVSSILLHSHPLFHLLVVMQSTSDDLNHNRATKIVQSPDEEFKSDPYFATDAFFEDYTVGGNVKVQGVVHMKKCVLKKCDPIREALVRVFGENHTTSSSKSFVSRRPADQLCYCTGWKYDISLRKSSIKCVGCGSTIRSSGHVCKIRFELKDGRWTTGWLSKKSPGTRVRPQNFELLAKHLPFVLPQTVVDSATDETPMCQSVVFSDSSL